VALLMGTLSAGPAFSKDGQGPINQKGGTGAVNIVGDNNNVSAIDPDFLAKVLRQVLREELARDASKQGKERARLEERLGHLEALLSERKRGADVDPLEKGDGDALVKANQEILHESPAVVEGVTKKLDDAVVLQRQVNQIKDDSGRAEAQAALLDAAFDRVKDMLVQAELDQSNGMRYGFLATTMSDSRFGGGGWGGAFCSSGSTGNGYVGRSASLTMAGGGDMAFGRASVHDKTSFLMSLAAHIGPRVRIGAPFAVSAGVYYDLPLFMIAAGKVSAPLVGIAADAGVQFGLVKVSALWRHDYVHLMYSQPDISFLGLGVTFINGHDGGNGTAVGRWTFGD
jgi:hypothetical protein